MQQMHPLRLQYEMFSNANPMMASVSAAAEQVRRNRKTVGTGNPFTAMQETVSGQIVATLDGWRALSEASAERTFLAVYRSPMLQAAVGIERDNKRPLRRASKNLLHQDLLQKRITELKARIPGGGLPAAVVRALIYAGMARGSVDERGFEAMRRIRESHGDMP